MKEIIEEKMEENKIMEQIAEPIPVEVLKSELTLDKRLRMTNKSSNEVYVVTWHDSPHVVREIGRLREIAFAQPEAEQARVSTLTSSTPAKTATSRFLSGTLRQKK